MMPQRTLRVDQALEPARRLPDWAELVEVSPSLRRFEQEASEAGERSFGFWLAWIRTYGDFRRAIFQASEATGCTFTDIMRVAVARLTAAYDRAFRQAQRKRAK